MQVGPDGRVRRIVGPDQIAGHLHPPAVRHGLWVPRRRRLHTPRLGRRRLEGKPERYPAAGLHLRAAKVNAAGLNARRCAGLEPAQPQAGRRELRRQPLGRCFTDPPAGRDTLAGNHAPVEKGTRRDHDAPGPHALAVGGDDSGHTPTGRRLRVRVEQ